MSVELNKANFRIALTSSGLTQTAWAQKYNISQPLISMILAGRRQPSKRLRNIMEKFISAQFARLRFVRIGESQKSAA
jgi:predicted transcriptional regulator